MRGRMGIVKSFLIAFSMYSRIPTPRFQWEERDMRYTFCFFPWVGAVIGVCVYGWNCLCDRCGIGMVCRAAVDGAIPLLITGGFHVDGFMDTVDGFHSYQSRERKLEILKDSHVGAFAVIMLALYGLIYLGAISEIGDRGLLMAVCGGFFLARCLSGIGAVSFPLAKGDGMLFLFADRAHKRTVKGALYVQSALCVLGMVWVSSGRGAAVAAAAFWAFWRYYRRCRRELGGITGDTAGYFVVVCEVCLAVAGAGADVFFRQL